jgi:hypothetical protein
VILKIRKDGERDMKGSMASLGRFLQLVGLIILPLAIVGNLSGSEPLTLGQSLSLSALGIGVFALGWAMQRGGPAR